MSADWFLREGSSSEPSDELWKRLPTPSVEDWTEPKDYLADAPLLAAVNTALLLGQPLLVTGEPGCGKTELANFIAWRLGLGRSTGPTDHDAAPAVEYALRFDMKSDTRARDLFYTIDLIERFHAAHIASNPEKLDPLLFMRFSALGRALLYGRTADAFCSRLQSWQAHPGQPRRSVVLIDEIDKAPGDVPNDLLMEIERMRVFIAEMNVELAAPQNMRPIVVITSNNDKKLSDAFLRRCAFYHIPFPDRDRLNAIVDRRLGLTDRGSPLVSCAIDEFLKLRELPLYKRPGTAELLAFVDALIGFGHEPGKGLETNGIWRQIAATSLLKTHDDQQRVAAAWALP
jgi:MoxR-like ATPase